MIAPCSAPGETLVQGQKKMKDVWGKRAKLGITDRSLIWNSDLIETLELDNLMYQAQATVDCAANRRRIPRRARPRGFPQARRRKMDEAFDRLGR